MDSREVIVRNKIELQDILMAHIIFVIDCVYQATLLTNRQYLALKCCAQSLPVKATTDLVDTMHGKGEETCKSFLRLLQDTKLTDVLPALRTMPWYSPPVATSTDPNTTCLDATQCCRPVQVVDNVNTAPKAGLGTGTPIQETGRCYQFLRETWKRDAQCNRQVCVLVLGDIGRSPRMQYHSLSLSRHGYYVNFVGTLGTKPHRNILLDERIRIVPIAEVNGIRVGPRIITYVTKVILQSLQIFHVLMGMDLQSHILMQNPPGLPSIAVVCLVCIVRGSTFIIDWHNYGYTIMALSHGQTHPVVRLAKWYEHFFGPLATHHLCVTNAMKDDLLKNWGIKATTLYDNPPSIFKETQVNLQHKLFVRLAESYPQFQPSGVKHVEGSVERTAFTGRNLADDTVTLASDRPALLLSSTSWTEDEDFSILLKALEKYEGFIRNGASLPSLLCVITGKGPQKEYYRKRIDTLVFEHVKICTPWLEAEDYPVLLGSADLGVCLHKSSSGLDLPMKVVDMFGCCLPVCAIRFNCLHELVKHEENGLIFEDHQELARQLKSLMSEFPSTEGRLAIFRSNLRNSRRQRWEDNWDQKVLPLISGQGPKI